MSVRIDHNKLEVVGMKQHTTELLIEYIHNTYPKLEIVQIKPSELVFEENVKMNCFYCGRYNSNWRCPPKLPDVDFEKMMTEYEIGMFVIVKLKFDDSNYADVRSESSTTLHKILLDLEKKLWNINSSTAISFIGGSCKLCKNGCGKERCNKPYMSRSPIEATGVNVVKSAAKYGIDITFPPKEYIMRVGLLLWQ